MGDNTNDSAPRSRWTCAFEGVPECGRGPGTTGDTLHRVSPKGGPFEGLCDEHMRDELTDAFGRLEDEANG